MPVRDLDAVFFIDSVPTMELRDGLFRIGYQIGRNAHFEVVITPHMFAKGMRAANRMLDEFHEGHEVVPMRKRAKH